MKTEQLSLPLRLLKAREAVMKGFVPSLREHDLSPQQWRVLRALDQYHCLDATEIARQSALLMPSLSRILQNLEKRGLVDRITPEEDQRRVHVSMTPAGVALFATLAPYSQERFLYINDLLGADKLAQLNTLLDELIAGVDADEAT
jgi:homoprotocatechuate degradation regulator HpaR